MTTTLAWLELLGFVVPLVQQLWAHGPFIGLRLAEHPVADYAIEIAMVVAGWALYWTTLPRSSPRRLGTIAIVPMLAALQAVYVFLM